MLPPAAAAAAAARATSESLIGSSAEAAVQGRPERVRGVVSGCTLPSSSQDGERRAPLQLPSFLLSNWHGAAKVVATGLETLRARLRGFSDVVR